MKKTHAHNVLSDKQCNEPVPSSNGITKRRCAKRLKLRLVEAKDPKNITKCYGCGQVYKRAEAKRKDLARRIALGRATR